MSLFDELFPKEALEYKKVYFRAVCDHIERLEQRIEALEGRKAGVHPTPEGFQAMGRNAAAWHQQHTIDELKELVQDAFKEGYWYHDFHKGSFTLADAWDDSDAKALLEAQGGTESPKPSQGTTPPPKDAPRGAGGAGKCQCTSVRWANEYADGELTCTDCGRPVQVVE